MTKGGQVWVVDNEVSIRWVLERSAALIDGGAAPVSGLVLPTGQFFPDEYDGSKTAVNRLLRRMVKLAGLSDLDIQAAVPSSEAEAGASCASGACGVDAGPSGRSTHRSGCQRARAAMRAPAGDKTKDPAHVVSFKTFPAVGQAPPWPGGGQGHGIAVAIELSYATGMAFLDFPRT